MATGAAALTLSACAGSSVHRGAVPSLLPAAVDVAGASEALQSAWLGYTRSFITAGGRVMDPTKGGDTTSEG
ncbi:MAG TPA: hypothetical protein VFA70_14785, partial [Dehalococcoidia bacterium]|nr:hypothetical protein [Dehalococcoidia bacterium]